MIRSQFILDILDLLLDVEEDALFIKNQIKYLSDNSDYEYTSGAGCFITFSQTNTEKIIKYKLDKNIVFDKVKIESEGIEAEAILHLKDGIIDNLEIWAHIGNYPNKELTSYTLSQEWEGSNKRVIKKYK